MKTLTTFGAALSLLASVAMAQALPSPGTCRPNTGTPQAPATGTIVVALTASAPACQPNPGQPRPPRPGTVILA
jgi:hypothetical protein